MKPGFLRPTASTVGLALLLLLAASLARYFIQARVLADLWSVGFPFAFYEFWGPCPPSETCRAFNWLLLIADAAICYLIVALATTAFRVVKRSWQSPV